MNSGQVASRTKDGGSTAADGAVHNSKRKAEDGLQGSRNKILKNGVGSSQVTRSSTPVDSRSARATVLPKPGTETSPNKAVPYRGTGKAQLNPHAAAVPSPTPSNVAVDTMKAPKKGSYAEIMARAKAGQSMPPAVGVISHKPKDKTISYKKELKLKKKAIRNKKLGIKDRSRPGSSGSLSSSPATVSSESRKAPQPAYKGTAKPKPQPTYKGTMKAGSTATSKPTSRDRDGYASSNRYNEYAATDEEDLDDIEEDDYGSEESEDMEAGFSDVDKEESVAAKAARKEDEEQARLEAKLKSEKEERKKKLEAMAKKAKPQRY